MVILYIVGPITQRWIGYTHFDPLVEKHKTFDGHGKFCLICQRYVHDVIKLEYFRGWENYVDSVLNEKKRVFIVGVIPFVIENNFRKSAEREKIHLTFDVSQCIEDNGHA